MVRTTVDSRQEIFDLLAGIADPEIPVLNIVEMGIVRDAEVGADSVVRVSITPTYSGCPAMRMIRDEIVARLQSHGFTRVEVVQVYAPAWSTDWITDEAKRKLKEYGIAPPRPTCGAELVPLQVDADPVPCPYCGSQRTELRSAFGSTACKEFHFCDNCHQPFEAFKTI